LVPASDGGDDFVGIGGPDERLGAIVGFLEEAVDGGLQIDDRLEDPALEAALGQFGEEAFDGIEPGSRSRGEMENKAELAIEPGAHLGVLVGGVLSRTTWIILPAGMSVSIALRKRMNS
jgi:hypothetical protein